MKSSDRARRVEERKRAELGEKVSIIQTLISNYWPDAYCMPTDVYLFHMGHMRNELEALIRAIDDEIKRVKG